MSPRRSPAERRRCGFGGVFINGTAQALSRFTGEECGESAVDLHKLHAFSGVGAKVFDLSRRIQNTHLVYNNV